MPRENRKRGKKHKKKAEDDFVLQEQDNHRPVYEDEQTNAAGPSWIVPAQDNSPVDPNAPFGYVDSEVKAYFRTVDVQIREWQETKPEMEADEDVDPNEDRRLFFIAALQEMSEKEKQLATDPDCSTILERMTYSMDDFVRRVFMDKLTGSLEQLSKHRFASHVCQTLLTVASDTVSREARGILPSHPDTQEDDGELRTFTQLTLDACEELAPSLSTLILDPFASHVIRALLTLLAPDVLSNPDDAASGSGKSGHALRSKRSAAYKARQGVMKSVFMESQEQGNSKGPRRAPKEFRKAAKSIVSALRDQLGETEVRALGANQVASPVLQMLLQIEAAYGLADSPGSIMDRALVGLITAIHENPDAEVPESDYLTTLLRDPTASHLLEILVRCSPERAFNQLWRIYFVRKLSKLAIHPVANFVVAKAFERLDVDQLGSATDELESVAGKVVKNARTGVLRALVDRASTLQADAKGVVELILHAFALEDDEARKNVVPCVLRLKTSQEYERALASSTKPGAEGDGDEARHKRHKIEDPLEPKTQGAILLQAMLRLPSPHNEVVLESVQAMTIEQLVEMAHHPTSSRVLDAVLDSATVPLKAKRKLVMAFLGHYHVLVDDRIGSRVGDRCWASADPYLKEKIARSLVPHEHTLAGSFYGKFFARNLHLHVLQRDPERWKAMQAATKVVSAPAPAVVETTGESQQPEKREGETVKEKGKRKAKGQDEIDVLFDATLGKKVRKVGLAGDEQDTPKQAKGEQHAEKGSGKKSKKRKDRDGDGLEDVLGAIRSAPKEDKGLKKRKRAH